MTFQSYINLVAKYAETLLGEVLQIAPQVTRQYCLSHWEVVKSTVC